MKTWITEALNDCNATPFAIDYNFVLRNSCFFVLFLSMLSKIVVKLQSIHKQWKWSNNVRTLLLWLLQICVLSLFFVVVLWWSEAWWWWQQYITQQWGEIYISDLSICQFCCHIHVIVYAIVRPRTTHDYYMRAEQNNEIVFCTTWIIWYRMSR